MSDPSNKPMRILVADDDETELLVLKTGLENKGFQVQTARDVMQSMQLAMRTMPDAIILDIDMPGGTGLSVVERLKRSTKTQTIPIIMNTSTAGPEAQARSVELGAVACLEKPVDIDEVAEFLKELIEK